MLELVDCNTSLVFYEFHNTTHILNWFSMPKDPIREVDLQLKADLFVYRYRRPDYIK